MGEVVDVGDIIFNVILPLICPDLFIFHWEEFVWESSCACLICKYNTKKQLTNSFIDIGSVLSLQ